MDIQEQSGLDRRIAVQGHAIGVFREEQSIDQGSGVVIGDIAGGTLSRA